MRKLFCWITCIIVAICLLPSTGAAAVVVTEMSTDSLGTNAVTWSSEFEDLDYTLGAQIVLTVTWTSSGVVEYDDVRFRSYTPKAKNDPALGTDPTFSYPGSDGANSVDVTFQFVDMHSDDGRGVAIGNGHFKLYLMVDEDGDGEIDAKAGFGFNIHAEDPQ